jgi:hypothetical protein
LIWISILFDGIKNIFKGTVIMQLLLKAQRINWLYFCSIKAKRGRDKKFEADAQKSDKPLPSYYMTNEP